MIIPNVNSECLNAYLEELSNYLGEREIILVLDGASWHRTDKLKKLANIEIVFLPPYSPELNPVERFWEYIKGNTIKNKVFENLHSLEAEITRFIQGITYEVTASVCNVTYLSNY